MLSALLVVFAVQCLVQTYMILSPEYNAVWENSFLELTCDAHINTTYTTWGTKSKKDIFSYLSISKEGECTVDGFLDNIQMFKTRCYRNATFKVTIKRVDMSYQGQEWLCYYMFSRSNTAFISVQVQTKYVRFKNISTDMLNTIEKIKTTLTCETSEGRPASNITWTKISNKGMTKDITNDIAYAVSRKETPTVRNLTIVRSTIEIEPIRDDNGTLIICEATNRKPFVVRKEITIHVQYPTGNPYFQFIGQNELVDNGTFFDNELSLKEMSSFTVICKADGYPLPTCTWNVEGHRDISSSSLTFTNISKDAAGSYKCFAENIMERGFPENKIKTNTSSDLEIDVQYHSSVVMFHIVGLDQKEDMFEATEGQTVVFSCSVDSNPESSMTLSFRGQELTHTLSAKALIHTIRIVSCFDDGVYKCAAQNKYNIKPSIRELRFHVKCRPRLSSEFKLTSTIRTATNHTIAFEFRAVANPIPKFRWFKLNETSWYNISTNIKYKIQTSGLNSSLSISNVTDDDYGYYKLEIENEVGTLEQMYILKSNDSIEEQEDDLGESSIHRIILFITIGIIGVATTTAVVIFFVYRHRRQEESKRQPSEEVNINQTTTSNTDNITLYDEIGNVYEHLDGQMKEKTTYMEMQTIKIEDVNKDYITPIM